MSGARPRPLARIVIDPNNAYARAGVAPSMTSQEIRRELTRKHAKLSGDAKLSGGRKELTEQLEQLGGLLDQLGDAKRRARYDAEHPENELLTVQPSGRDAMPAPARLAALATGWLLDEGDPEAWLPHPESLSIWCPGGVSTELTEFLQAFSETTSTQPDPDSGAREAKAASPTHDRIAK